jgi:hypothetical protein
MRHLMAHHPLAPPLSGGCHRSLRFASPFTSSVHRYTSREGLFANTVANYNRFVSGGDYIYAVRVAEAAYRLYLRSYVGPRAEVSLRAQGVQWDPRMTEELVLRFLELFTTSTAEVRAERHAHKDKT